MFNMFIIYSLQHHGEVSEPEADAGQTEGEDVEREVASKRRLKRQTVPLVLMQ